jgi:predicted Zn finger-like uncharacterized protein
MNVTCPNCATVYRVDPAKVPEAGVRARCNVCSAVFPVGRESPAPRAAVPAQAPSLSTPVAGTPRPPEPPRSQQAIPALQSAPPAPAPMTSVPVPPRPVTPQRPPPPASPATPAAAASRPPSSAPQTRSTPAAANPSAPPRPAPAAVPPAPKAAPLPSAAPRATAAGSGPPPGAARPAGSTSAPVSPPVRPAAPGSRPVNPFLSQDPSLKARRLARALISDMVVYHPGKRQEGLRDGNLKQLFEEEIKKSWEEYAEQVGRDVAESTSYFREALNEILAGGRQVF